MSDNNLTFKVLSLFASFFPLIVMSQPEDHISAIKTDTVISKKSQHSLYSTIGYGSNMIYLGSTISQDQPYGYGAVTYGFKDKLYLTATAVHLAGISPFAAFYAGTASYSHVFNSWFDISTSISRYQVAPSLTDTLFNSFFYGDITLGTDWRILYTKISAGGLWSDGTRAYFQVRNSRYFETPGFTPKKFYFSFDPYFNILAGTMTKAETITGTTVTLTPPFRKKGKNNHGSSTTKYTTVYGIMEADFGIPVSFNTSHLTIEAEPYYLVPAYEDPEYPGMKGFNFQISVYYRIF
jgi:hypothetical protein